AARDRKVESRFGVLVNKADFISHRCRIEIDNCGDSALFANSREVLPQAVTHINHRMRQTELADLPSERHAGFGSQMRSQRRLPKTVFVLVHTSAVQQ